MATTNPAVARTWTLIVSDSARDFFLSIPFESPLRVEVATSDDVDAFPDESLHGHYLKPAARESINRAVLGTGYVFARSPQGPVNLVLNSWGTFPLLFDAGLWDTAATWLTDRTWG